MIIIGTVMAMAAGSAVPSHIFLFGQVINQFVYYSIAVDIPSVDGRASNLSLTCSQFIDRVKSGNETLREGGDNLEDDYFCDAEDSDVFDNILDFVCDPKDTFTDRISVFSLYYIALATSVLFAMFLAAILWNISAYRQSKRMRLAFYHSVLRQEIGWFDVNESAQLSTRLAE